MAVDPGTGMDIYVKDRAAEKVAGLFDQLSQKLDALRSDFDNFTADMGMGKCHEGHDWNDKVSKAADAIYQEIGTYVDDADSFRNKANASQAAFDHSEDRNENLFLPVNGSQAYPSYK